MEWIKTKIEPRCAVASVYRSFFPPLPLYGIPCFSPYIHTDQQTDLKVVLFTLKIQHELNPAQRRSRSTYVYYSLTGPAKSIQYYIVLYTQLESSCSWTISVQHPCQAMILRGHHSLAERRYETRTVRDVQYHMKA